MPMTSDAVTSGVARVATRTGGACCVAIVKTSGRLHFFFPNFKKNGKEEEGGGGGGDEETKEPARRDERRRTGATLSGCRRRVSFSPSSFIPFFLFCFLSFKYFWNKTKMHRQPLVRTFKLTHEKFRRQNPQFSSRDQLEFRVNFNNFFKNFNETGFDWKSLKATPVGRTIAAYFFLGARAPAPPPPRPLLFHFKFSPVSAGSFLIYLFSLSLLHFERIPPPTFTPCTQIFSFFRLTHLPPFFSTSRRCGLHFRFIRPELAAL